MELSAGVVKDTPVYNSVPPVAEEYQLYVGLVAAEMAVSVVLLPWLMFITPLMLLMLGMGFTLMVTDPVSPLKFAVQLASLSDEIV